MEQLALHEPAYSLAVVERFWRSSGADPSLRERHLDGLRKAGMKE